MITFNEWRHKSLLIWQHQRYKLSAITVLLNSLLIFKTVYGMSAQVFSPQQLSHLADIDFTVLTNAPWFMLGAFLLLNSIGLLFRARIAWVMSLVLLLTTLVFTVHYYSNLLLNIVFCSFSIILLLFQSRDFNRSSATAAGIVSIISFVILIIYSTYGSLYFGDGFSPKITDLSMAFYFAMVTMTTVGYGDILPVTETARLFTISMIIAGIAVFATSVSTIFGPFIRDGLSKLIQGKKHTMKRADHFIVCGTSAMATNTIIKLHQRGLAVTIITVRPSDEFEIIEQSLEGKFDIISGDSSDTAVLKQAGLEQCRAILALTDNDADNAFIVLSAKDLSANAKTVIIVNDSKNLSKIQRVQPDVLLSPQLFGSEVLARMLNGETMDNNDLAELLLNSAHGIPSKTNL
ncbi:voltage-gated potassium channel protein [Shewanella schlegeliana]|uniref:voltage-gated potassium channel protein n=1 Tax=Shewanella schlegeliana TaxID=190308 RepID=UPI001ED94D79|nr:voltage-gated potassium channel protein [Shewanella schlegeliana]MCL1110234.1 voltage-gated potassium channel protein [Shewanella schlegeliana]